MSAPTADANIWLFGKTWSVHARHPHSGNWIRLTGIATRNHAVVEADALCWRLDHEYERAAALSVSRSESTS